MPFCHKHLPFCASQNILYLPPAVPRCHTLWQPAQSMSLASFCMTEADFILWGQSNSHLLVLGLIIQQVLKLSASQLQYWGSASDRRSRAHEIYVSLNYSQIYWQKLVLLSVFISKLKVEYVSYITHFLLIVLSPFSLREWF